MKFVERAKQAYRVVGANLPTAEVTEYGIAFKTGHPVTFHFVRNTESSKKFKIPVERFQQNIEPAGRYMIHNPDPGDLPETWEEGDVTFQHPLVLQFNGGTEFGYNEHSWKAVLYKHYGKTGKSLTQALIKDGYDGIVTVHDNSTREIVQLKKE
jgi:hypothetical protein